MANFLIIRSLAEKKKISIRELAKRVGMTEQGLQALIKKGSTNTATIESIAGVLGVPVSIFFDEGAGLNIASGHQSIAGNSNTISGNISITLPEKGFQKIIRSDGSQAIVEVTNPCKGSESRELAAENLALHKEISDLKNKIIELQARLLDVK